MPPLIITDLNAAAQVQQRRQRLRYPESADLRGVLPRINPYGSIPHAKPATDRFPRIPRDQWKKTIENDAGPWLHDLCKNFLPPHDQGGTNYCWAHGSVRAVETLRVYEAQRPCLLSAESVAVPITGGRNRGGSPDEALERLRNYGACDQSFWPLNNLNQRNARPGWQTDALNHCVLDWLDVQTWDDQITLALRRVPVAIGLDWWGHLVCQLDPVILPNGEIGIGIDNSWGSDWGDNGYGVLDEKHGTADLGAFAPLSETFSAT